VRFISIARSGRPADLLGKEECLQPRISDGDPDGLNIDEIVETNPMESSSISTPTSTLTPTPHFVVSNSNQQSQLTIDPTSVFIFGSITISLLAGSVLVMIPKQIRPPFQPKLRCKVSCQNCRYFSANPYLKCALHPDTVLTDAAVDCRDYRSN
jgi:hypothetical protein